MNEYIVFNIAAGQLGPFGCKAALTSDRREGVVYCQ
jgi:hypothetical protein